MSGVFVTAVVCATLATPALSISVEPGVFRDDFEVGDASSWSAVVGGPPITAPAALRFTSLEVRDPHFFAGLGFLCQDFTDSDGGGLLSVNGALATAMDSDVDSDGFLDLSLMLLFRPFATNAVGEIVDVRNGACDYPASGTSCGADTSGPVVRGTYDVPSGPCLTIHLGTTSSYSPDITEPTSPCFTTAPLELSLMVFGDQELPLRDAQIGATTDGTAPDELKKGLILGFLREEDADAISLPAGYPIVGGQPVSILFPGGTGNCDSGDDTEMHGGYNGWWFYLNFTAENVTWTGL